jgi:GNAT superfamily N-acetyltransferase
MAITLLRTESSDPRFLSLVRLLDTELAQRDGEEHGFFAQFNKVDSIRRVVLALDGEEPAGCGAIKPFTEGVMEIKRMFVLPACRGQGVALNILHELEAWARESGAARCVLETGIRMPEAIALYKKCGYRIIPNYGPYAGVESSVCFEKLLPETTGNAG